MRKEVQDIVKKVLLENEKAREDDFVLISDVLEIVCPKTKDMTIGYVLLNSKELGIPPFASITRARRKIFKENPELCPERIRKIREQEEKRYREWSKENEK